MQPEEQEGIAENCISRSALINKLVKVRIEIRHKITNEFTKKAALALIKYFIKLVNDQPGMPMPEARKHGCWSGNGLIPTCSECHQLSLSGYSSFCSHCGAKMEGFMFSTPMSESITAKIDLAQEGEWKPAGKCECGT